MSGYVYFTEEQKQKANSVDLVAFLQRQGEKLLPSGRDKRLASDHSITIRNNQWFDHSSAEGSHAIDLVRRLYNLSFPEAVTLLLGGGGRGIEYRQSINKEPEQKSYSSCHRRIPICAGCLHISSSSGLLTGM